MIGRVTTFHNYHSVQNDLQRQENKISHNQEQFASGKRILKTSDDPLGTLYTQNLKQETQEVDQYVDSIVLIRNRLDTDESTLKSMEQYVDDSQKKVLAMINGALSEDDRHAYAQELGELSNNLFQLANTKDEHGNYRYAGTKVDTQPFFRDQAGAVAYAGNDNKQTMKISSTIVMPISTPGSELLMDIDNPYGDYQPEYQLTSGSDLMLEKAWNNNSNDHSTYKLSFVDMGDGQVGYQLEQDAKAVQFGVYDIQDGIEFDSMQIKVKGKIQAGDQLTLAPQKSFNVFDTLNKAVEYSTRHVSDASGTAELQQVADELAAVFIHLNQMRTDFGTRLQTLDVQEQQHEDYKLTLNRSKSTIEDLDYSKAMIDFNENMTALQASQQAFGKTKTLSLFNYI